MNKWKKAPHGYEKEQADDWSALLISLFFFNDVFDISAAV